MITRQQVKEKRKCDSKSVFKKAVSENGGCRRELHLARISTPTNLKKPSSFLFLNSSAEHNKVYICLSSTARVLSKDFFLFRFD